MLIVCPHCATSYQVEEAAVGPAGRSVRCVRCRTVWFAANTGALSDIAAAHRAEMTEFAVPDSGPEAPPAAPPDGEGPARGAAEASVLIPPNADARLAAGDIAVVDDAPPIAEQDPGDALAAPMGLQLDRPVVTVEATASAGSGGEDIETVAARRSRTGAKRQRKALRLPGWSTIIMMLVALDLGLIGWRTDIVRWAPQTAPLYAAIGLPVNVRGLIFTDVKVETQSHEGVTVLVVRGTIATTAARTVEVPRLRFAARNAGGDEIYKWTALPDRAVLAPGERLPFQSQLASPPPETHDVLVRFFTRRDLRAGIE